MTRRPWALPLVPLYAAALVAKEKLRALSPPKALVHPVISVGSVSAGGAGKTPVVIALTRLLRSHGWQVDILTRGYGREGRGLTAVDPELPDAARIFGDEPVLLSLATGIPVYVGANRFAAGQLAEQAAEQFTQQSAEQSTTAAASPPRLVHLLDDGFQHRRLARTLDIVLLTAEDLADTLLPAGNLREPLRALRRADVVLIREEERALIEPHLTSAKTSSATPNPNPDPISGRPAHTSPLLRPGALLWSVHRRLQFPSPLGVLSAGLRPVAFCAIARPENFAAMLLEAGCGVVETVAFPDHHALSSEDLDALLKVARDCNGSGFVTTEKDAVKLTPVQRAQLETLGPLAVVALEASFVYPERTARELAARLSRGAGILP